MMQRLREYTTTTRSRRGGWNGRRPASPATGKRRLSRRFSVFLLAMTYGSAVALLVVTAGFTTLLRDGTTVAGEASQGRQAAADGHGHGHGGHSAAGPHIRIEARHLGNLVVDIKTHVSMNRDRDPLIKAKVVAFTDMVQMPNVHTQGPLPLRAAPGKPGLYESTVELSMPGDYDIRVVVKDPVHGETTTTIPVRTAHNGNGTKPYE